MRIGVIGTGTVATAVVRGIAPDGHQITVSARSAANARALAGGAFATVTIADNQTVLDASDVVLIGTTGAQADAALAPLTFRADHIVISLMADMPLDHVARLIAPPAEDPVMLIPPFPVIATGGSPVLTCPPSPTVQALVGARNLVLAFDDPARMAPPFMAAQATLSPALKLVATAGGDWLADRTGDPPSRGLPDRPHRQFHERRAAGREPRRTGHARRLQPAPARPYGAGIYPAA